MDFGQAHIRFIRSHLDKRTGERRGRLERGHLHEEYMPPYAPKLLFEIKGFNSHVKEMDRQGFDNECKRELFLSGLGFQVLSFAYDDILQQPELLIAMLRMVLSRSESTPMINFKLSFAESEVIRLAMSLSYTIRPIDVTGHLRMNYRWAANILQGLSEQGFLVPVSGSTGERIVRYELARSPFGVVVTG